MTSINSTRRSAASALGAVNNGGSNEPVAQDADQKTGASATPGRMRMQTAIRSASPHEWGSASFKSHLNRRALRELFAARRDAKGAACPSLSRARRMESPVVFCDRDPNAKPLIPRKYEKAVSIAAFSVLMTFLLLACALFGGAETVFFGAAK